MDGDRRGPEWPIEPDQPRVRPESTSAPRQAAASPDAVKRRERGISPLLIALGGLLLLLLVLWLFSGRNPDQDKLSDDQLGMAKPASAEKLCTGKATYDLIKRELFRRAAQLRGSDQAAFDRLSAYAVLRVENPVMENEDLKSGAASCSASMALDLPPGVAVVGGRRTLAAELDYTVQPAADGSGRVVLLRNPDPIVTPLATLARIAQPTPQPQLPPEANMVAPVDPVAPPPAADQPATQPARPVGARPSFDCDRARTRGEIAVCSSASLASLDRQMAAQYGRAIAVASPAQRRLLQQTRDRFLGYRDRCPNTACMGDAYTGRMREISDIMAGRWQPPR